MKKIILSVIAIFLAFVAMPLVKAEEKVPVYMFTKDGCSACDSAHEYFDDLEKDYPDLFEVIVIEVFDNNWKATSPELQELLISIYDEFGEDSSKAATPTIVIGEYHTVGLPQDTSAIYDAIIDARDSEVKVDKVKEYADEIGVDINKFRKEEETGGKYDTLIVVGIFVILIGGFVGLIVAGKK